jgi:hypothetical protein
MLRVAQDNGCALTDYQQADTYGTLLSRKSFVQKKGSELIFSDNKRDEFQRVPSRK